MTTTCTWATEKDKHELIDFIDFVFSKAHRPHNFATLLPKLYGEKGDAAPHHIVVREDGRIAGTMVAYPVTMHVAGEDVLTLGIGSVSVHPRSRGKGYMKLMMDAVDARAAELGAMMAVLGGRRQRYEYFGYEKTGLELRAFLDGTNVRHALRDVDTAGFDLVPMTEAHVPAALALQEGQTCYCRRKAEQFIDILRSWEAQPLALTQGGRFLGYCALTGEDVDELLLTDEALALVALKLLSQRQEDLTLHAALWEKERAALLTRICESFQLLPDNQYKFYQPERVKQLFSALGEGELTWRGFTPSLPLYLPGPDRV